MTNITLYLPNKTRVSLGKGDTVTAGSVLAEGDAAPDVSYNLISLLGIKASEVASAVLKKEGEKVSKGDILVRKRGVLSTKSLRATFSGTIARIDSVLGTIEIRPDEIEKFSLVSPVDGTIAKIGTDEIVIDFPGQVFFAKQGLGGMKRGHIEVLSEGGEEIPIAQITDRVSGKILLGGKFSRQVLEKAFALGAASVVTTAQAPEDFVYFEEKHVLDPSLLLVSSSDYASIVQYAGKEAVVEGEHKRIIIV